MIDKENQVGNDDMKPNLLEEGNIRTKKSQEINLFIINQVFEKEAFLNNDYYRQFNLRFRGIKLELRSIDEKFDDIGNYLWSSCNPNFDIFSKSQKLRGYEMKNQFKSIRDTIVVRDFGLPKMVCLPLGSKGQDVSEKQLMRAIAYSEAMNVFEGDDDTIVIYKGKQHDRAKAKLIFMYVAELIIKNKLKQTLKEDRENWYGLGYHSHERIFHYIMDYSDTRFTAKKALYLESLLSKDENDSSENDNYTYIQYF